MRKVVFIHIPRTAGKSFFNDVRQHLPPPVSKNPSWAAYLNDWRSKSYRFVGGHVNFTIADYIGKDNLEMVTIFRDPIDRSFSLFRHMQNHPVFVDWREMYPQEAQSFEAFLANPVTNYQTRNAMCRYLGSNYGPSNVDLSDPHLIDHFLRWSVDNESDRDVYERAIDRMGSFSFVGLKEKYGAFVRSYLEAHGIRPPHIAEKAHARHRESISPGELDMVSEANEYDLKLYALAAKTYG